MKGFQRSAFICGFLCMFPVAAYAANPYQQIGQIGSTSPVTGGFFGVGVALSSDGQTALFGQDGTNKAFVFNRTNGVWRQAFEMDDPGTAASDFFGNSVALSGDGSTALVCSDAGSVYVYSSAGGAWTLMTTFTNPQPGFEPGTSPAVPILFCQDNQVLALSADGTTAIIGLPEQTVSGVAGAGAAYVYTSHNGTWSVSAAITEPVLAGDNFGTGIAVDAAGANVLIGTSGGGSSAYLFSSSSGPWTLSHTFSNPIPFVPGSFDDFGLEVALSADATRAIVTAPFTAVGGTAYIFTETGGVWGAPAQFHDATRTSGYFGEELGFSRDGNSAFFVEESSGRVFYTQFSSSAWNPLTEITDLPSDQFKHVAVSADGSIALVSAGGVVFEGVTQAGEVFDYSTNPPSSGTGSGAGGSTPSNSGGGGPFPPLLLGLLVAIFSTRRRVSRRG